jgi:hypothetical protein
MFPGTCWYGHFYLFWYVELVTEVFRTFQLHPVYAPYYFEYKTHILHIFRLNIEVRVKLEECAHSNTGCVLNSRVLYAKYRQTANVRHILDKSCKIFSKYLFPHNISGTITTKTSVFHTSLNRMWMSVMVDNKGKIHKWGNLWWHDIHIKIHYDFSGGSDVVRKGQTRTLYRTHAFICFIQRVKLLRLVWSLRHQVSARFQEDWSVYSEAVLRMAMNTQHVAYRPSWRGQSQQYTQMLMKTQLKSIINNLFLSLRQESVICDTSQNHSGILT